MISTGSLLVGKGRLIDPRRVRRVWVSPRQRAIDTFRLLFRGSEVTQEGNVDWQKIAGVSEGFFGGGEGSIVVTEEIREWDYGEYEGMKKAEVKELRRQKGLEKEGVEWTVWRDGCEGGE